MTSISNDMMQNIFRYMNQRKNENKNKNENNNNKYPIRNELIFGEELSTFYESFENTHHAIYGRNALYPVKDITARITLEFYQGEPRHVDSVAGIYEELVKARVKKGLTGLKGFNMKGVVVAILFMIISHEHKSRLDINKLIKAANKVRSSTSTKITSKMLLRYIKMILDNIKQYNTYNLNSNNNDNIEPIEQEIKRIAIKVGYTTKPIIEIKKLVKKVPVTVIKSHQPHSIASALVYIYMIHLSNNINKKNAVKIIGISQYTINTIVPKIIKYFNVSVSIVKIN